MARTEEKFLISSLMNNGRLYSIPLSFNWDYFLNRAKEEKIEPIIYNNLKAGKILSALPEEVRERLERSYYRTARDNTIFAFELRRIVRSFSEKGIDTILLKGIPLAEELYGNLALRETSDIDILIRPEDFPFARLLLEGMGFHNKTDHMERFQKDNVEIDLHWHLTTVRVKSRIKIFDINMKNMWRRARAIIIDGEKTKVPSPQDLLIYLCLHFSLHHGARGLRWLLDISRLIERYEREIDWAALVKEAKDSRLNWPVYIPLYIVSSIFKNIPLFALEKLKPRGFNLLRQNLIKLSLYNRGGEEMKFFITWLSLSGLNKVKVLGELIFPDKNTIKTVYYLQPSRPIWAGYLIHWQKILSSIFNQLYP